MLTSFGSPWAVASASAAGVSGTEVDASAAGSAGVGSEGGGAVGVVVPEGGAEVETEFKLSFAFL